MFLPASSFVKIMLNDGEIQFAKLHSDLEVIVEVTGLFPAAEVFYFLFDPLTSRGMPMGLCNALPSEVANLQPVQSLPVQDDFVIDSVAAFYAGTGIPDPYSHDAKTPASAFLGCVANFVLRSGIAAELSHDQFWMKNFEPLGLDFMRQHYRSVKRHFLIERILPPHAILQFLLESTIHSPTKNADWSHCRIPG